MAQAYTPQPVDTKGLGMELDKESVNKTAASQGIKTPANVDSTLGTSVTKQIETFGANTKTSDPVRPDGQTAQQAADAQDKLRQDGGGGTKTEVEQEVARAKAGIGVELPFNAIADAPGAVIKAVRNAGDGEPADAPGGETPTFSPDNRSDGGGKTGKSEK